MPGMIVKKYSNRRLYDTEASRYMTLEELSDKFRAGVDARVVDAQTGEDLTQHTLTQIILESRGAAKLLPVPILQRLVRLGDDNLAEFFGQYVAWALEVYLQAKQGALTLGAFNPFGGGAMSMNPFARMLGFGQGMGGGMGGMGSGMGGYGEPSPPPPVTAPAPPPPASPTMSELDALRKELESIKRSVQAAPRPRKRKKS